MSIVQNVVCLGCGCACDDIVLLVDSSRIVEARNACPLGDAWFGDGRSPAQARVRGREATLDEALDAAAAVLGGASRPLVFLAPELSCEAQREGVAIADLLRATLDTVTAVTVMPSLLAQQERGRASATLGEIRNRADVLVFWGVDPTQRYPRYSTRYAPVPTGLHVPNGRSSRTVVAVDIGDRRGPDAADVRVTVSAEHEVAALTAIRALATAPHLATDRVSPASGSVPEPVPLPSVWRAAAELAPLLTRGRYVVVVADGEPGPDGADCDPGGAAALIALTQALNGPTRAALSLLRAGGNRSGADAAVTWQTGYPASVDFSRGYPRYRPHERGAESGLRRGTFDGVLVLGDAHAIPQALVSLMSRLPCAAIGPRVSASILADQDAVIDSAVAGIHEAGTAIRMDEVPLPLRAVLAGPPEAAALARALREHISPRRG